MRELHIIVHEETVQAYGADDILKKIQEIKSSGKDYLEFGMYDEWTKLHPNMPPVSDDLLVFVSGAKKKDCVAHQLLALKNAGYNSRYNHEACFQGMDSPGLGEWVLDLHPDFYD